MATIEIQDQAPVIHIHGRDALPALPGTREAP
jgi:hypothetical protein